MAPSLTLSAHLETCRECRRRVRSVEEAEAELLVALPPAQLAPDALERALDAIATTGPAAPEIPAEPDQLGDVRLPSALARLGLGGRRFLGPGLWAAPVNAAPIDGWRTFLLRTPPGTVVPTHGHRGGELVAVLSGGFRDGETYRAGDFAESVTSQDHHLQATADGACVCLIAIQGRIQWRGWAKIIGPVLGM